jgi:hypothetical protein
VFRYRSRGKIGEWPALYDLATMDFEDAVFRAPPREFTKARDALVAALKKAGRADDAKAAKALRRPPLPVWMFNRLVLDGAEGAKKTVQVVEQLGRAIAGDDMQAAGSHIAQLRAAGTELVEEARELAAEVGVGFTLAQERELAALVQALPWHEHARDAAARGRLTEVPPPVDPLEAMRLGAGAPPLPRQRDVEPPATGESAEATRQEQELAEAQDALADAQSRLEGAEAATKSAMVARDQARAAVERADKAFAEAEQRLRDATTEQRTCARAVDDARKQLASLSRRVR